ncbi:MAG: hypothetical protein AAGE59_02350 [Cyanobacteria bacterium P01_F01_bin.86]
MLKSQSLMQVVFHFNEADLYDNRNGQISDRQKMRLRCMQILSLPHLLTILFAGIQSVIVIQVSISAITLFQANDWFGFSRLFIGIIVLIPMNIYLIACLIKRLRKLARDIQNGQVERKKGTVTFRRYGRKRIAFAYLMQIEGKSYLVTCWQMWTFRQNREYFVYIAPQMKLVLSAELVQI